MCQTPTQGLRGVLEDPLPHQERADVADPPGGRAEHSGELVGVFPLLVLQLGQHALGDRVRVDLPPAPARHQRPSRTAVATRSGAIAAIASRQCSHGILHPQASPGAASSIWLGSS